MIRTLILPCLLGLSLGLTACGGAEQESTSSASTTTETKTSTPPAPKSRLSDAHTARLMDMMGAYYEVKDALIKTDAPRASQTASKLMSAAEMLNHDLQSDSANYASLRPAFETVMSTSEQITNLKDETCEKQRAEFEKTSAAMYGLLKQADFKSGQVYQQYCPMAFNDKGAYWLSNVEDIANPYLPKTMLHCGEVRDTL